MKTICVLMFALSCTAAAYAEKPEPTFVQLVSFRSLIDHNNAVISKLTEGMKKAEVIASMGPYAANAKRGASVINPMRGESSREGSNAYDVVFYITSPKSAADWQDRSLMTPLLFKNDELIGRGWESVNKLYYDRPRLVSEFESGVRVLLMPAWKRSYIDRAAMEGMVAMWTINASAEHGVLAIRFPLSLEPAPISLDALYDREFKALQAQSEWTKEKSAVDPNAIPFTVPTVFQYRQLSVRADIKRIAWTKRYLYLSTPEGKYVAMACSLPTADVAVDDPCAKAVAALYLIPDEELQAGRESLRAGKATK